VADLFCEQQLAESFANKNLINLILAGADYSTAKEISDIIGKRLLIERNHLSDVEKHYHELTLLTPDQIRTLGSQQAVFLSKNRHPILVNITPYYEHSAHKHAVNKNPYAIPENKTRDDVTLIEI
jgi:type IV secretory pathway TraG/TraD family ATPase VirD4